jgi:hypothetical protein
VEAGASARGRDELLGAARGEDAPGLEWAFRPYLYEVLTRAELALGRVEEADGWARRATACAAGLELGGPTGWALRASAEVALARGDAALAGELAVEASVSHGAAHRIEAARSLIVAGRAGAAAGDRARAVVKLRRAAAELEACGARGYRDQAADELRRLGETVPDRGRETQTPRG